MTLPKRLEDMDATQFKGFLDSFDHVFSDCDGVIWRRTALPRVGEFFDLMKSHGKTVHFVSNNSIRSKEQYDERFDEAKIVDGYKCLTTPSIAIAEYLKIANFKKKVYSVACVETVRTLESYGIQCKTGPDVPAVSYIDFLNYLTDDDEIGAVVFDSDFGVNLAKLYRAITYLKNPEVLFLAGASDKYLYFTGGQQSLGCAIFTDIVAEESARTPTILGKPSKSFGELAMRRTGVTDPKRVLFIGDMIEQDVGLGKATGFKTLLLLTNTSKETMLEHSTITPDYYADSLESIVPLLCM